MSTPTTDDEQTYQSLLRARQLHADGELDEAEEILRGVLEEDSCQVDALSLLGFVYHARGDGQSAEAMMARAVALQPEHPPNCSSLGDLYRWLKQPELALACYRNGLKVESAYLPCLEGMFVTLREVGHRRQAAEVGETIVEIAPDNFEARHNLGALYVSLGEFDNAIKHLSRALEMREDLVTRQALAGAYALSGDASRAASEYRLILEQDPDNAIAAHHLAASSDAAYGDPDRASDEYVKQTFDRFADSFDRVLGDLRYQAPAIIKHLFETAADEPNQQYEVLDLGCGTGLCGVEIAGFAKRLVGIDLSEKMLSKAQGTGVYDELAQAELGAYLKGGDHRYDFIISGDTLIYLGDLRTVCVEARRRLKPQGWLLFTAEALNSETDEPHVLGSSGRYAHSRTYLTKTLETAGFDIEQIMEVHLRVEVGVPVEGFAIAAQSRT